MLKKEKLALLLNRSLTTAETDNYDLYLKIAIEKLESLLCFTVCGDQGERTFESRTGYRTLYVDPFTDITSVTIDGNETEDYVKKQNDKFNGSWYNVIEFDRKQTGKNVVVDADWGFNPLPSDLQLLLARLFDQGSIEQTSDGQVKSKKIEDFSVTYKDSATYDEFVMSNASVIDKYAQCSQGYIRHGSVTPTYLYGDNDVRPVYYN
jgi:hypothetical protein